MVRVTSGAHCSRAAQQSKRVCAFAVEDTTAAFA